MRRVRDAQSGIIVNLSYSIADARRMVQESSRRIAALVRRRPVTDRPTPDERREQERIDAEIAAIQRDRADALVEVVLAENPTVEIVDRARGIYRVPLTDGRGRVQWMYGSISVVWHLRRVSPSVFDIGARIRAQPSAAALPPGTQVGSRLLVGGSGIQSTVQPFPGDIDFGEEFEVTAPDVATAGAAMAAVVAEFVGRTAGEPDFEFVRLRIMPVRRVPGRDYVWSKDRILDSGQRAELGAQLADLQGGKVNTDWRALIEGGRYIEITKVLGIHAFSSTTGRELLATTWMGAEFQEAYLDRPPEIEPVHLGEYAALMRKLALKEARDGHYLKAAKRAFNYLRAIGNVEGMAAVTPIFSTTEARLNQQVAVLESIQKALNPLEVRTRVLTADRARTLMFAAADAVERDYPGSPGSGRPIADELRAIGRAIRGAAAPRGMVEPDGALAEQLDRVITARIKPAIDRSLEERVSKVIKEFVE
jgi:hypothetical protein